MVRRTDRGPFSGCSGVFALKKRHMMGASLRAGETRIRPVWLPTRVSVGAVGLMAPLVVLSGPMSASAPTGYTVTATGGGGDSPIDLVSGCDRFGCDAAVDPGRASAAGRADAARLWSGAPLAIAHRLIGDTGSIPCRYGAGSRFATARHGCMGLAQFLAVRFLTLRGAPSGWGCAVGFTPVLATVDLCRQPAPCRTMGLCRKTSR